MSDEYVKVRISGKLTVVYRGTVEISRETYDRYAEDLGCSEINQDILCDLANALTYGYVDDAELDEFKVVT